MIFGSDRELDFSFWKNLGGWIKAARKVEVNLEPEKLAEYLDGRIEEGRVTFGMSVYGFSQKERSDLYRGALTTKKILVERGRSCRLVWDDHGVLSAVTVDKNNLLDKGVELVAYKRGGEVEVYETVFVQEFEEFSERDYGRPSRDPRSGMLPPKLARMMINLAGVRASDNPFLVDPFCGSGTVATEALDMGYRHLGAWDISPKCWSDTQANVAWQLGRMGLDRKDVDFVGGVADAKTLGEQLDLESVDAFVWEGYLGPSDRRMKTLGEASKIMGEMDRLYQDVFSVLSRILKKGGVIVAALPVFYLGEGEYKWQNFAQNPRDFVMIDIKKIATGAGLELSAEKNIEKPLMGSIPKRGTILYGRADQKVLREIVRLVKN